MDPNDFTEIGYFQKPHGYRGQLPLFVTVNQEVMFNKLTFLVLEINGMLTPFFIEKIDAKGKILVKLEGCNDEHDAKKFQSKKVSVPKEFVIASDETEIDDLVGYTLIDETKGAIGKIIRIEEMPGNDMFVVLSNDKEVLLPIVDDLVIEIDDAEKTLRYNAPEGLIDLYLEN
ncbi:MAG TPA: ribosome maturation factor RimM [Bacteroidia bacterium]